MDFLLDAGGHLKSLTGNAISQVASLCSSYGTTETVNITGLIPSHDDWGYLEWHPAYRVNMQPSVDSSYKLVLGKDSIKECGLPVFEAFPDVEDWAAGDFFKSHPSKPTYDPSMDALLILLSCPIAPDSIAVP